MKKTILVILTCMLTFIQGCSKFNDDLAIPEEIVSEINLPQESEEYGKAVAKELRLIVNNLNEKGIDYTQVNKSAKVKRELFDELYKDIPKTKGTQQTNNFNIVSTVSQESINQLTDKQVALIKDITAEYKNSKSDEEFLKKLQKINDRIYSLPKIEQERLFKLSAVLYYGLKEVQYLRKQGLMAPAGSFAANRPRLKSFNEDGDDDNGGDGSCMQAEYITAVAVGEEVIWNGLKHVVKQAAYSAARAMWIITACLIVQGDTDTTDYHARCQPWLTACLTKNETLPYNQKMDCRSCYDYCTNNKGHWDSRCNVNGYL